ncbi:MAG TPA: hypothetical protein VNE40_03350 [Candidatus Dormibacteraeota bacterium]|nr:hypothetical protein [Candidatus Dormibacteraeota bacterium]
MRRFLLLMVVTILLLGTAFSVWALNRPLSPLKPISIVSTLASSSSNPLPWPNYGQAAIGASGYQVLATHGSQAPQPTASVAKLVTALAVLQKMPLSLGQQGPELTIGNQDIAFYQAYVAGGGSVVPVNYGEQISEYQVLQAMMLPSANNLADSLAFWAFGSLPAYVSYANSYVKQIGLHSTTIADASGFSASTVSTASDLVSLGEIALQQPVLAQIVSQPQATIPVAGTIRNLNSLVGQDGILGIKTGNTDQAGGVYVVAGNYTLVDNHRLTLVVAIMGAPSLGQAIRNAPPLLAAAQANFSEQTVISAGNVVGYVNTPWGTSVNIVAAKSLAAFGWKGTPFSLSLSLEPQKAPLASGQVVGKLMLAPAVGNTPEETAVVLQRPLAPPSWQWRLLHGWHF